MRFFTALAAFGLVALATAQNATTTKTQLTSPVTISKTATNTASLSPQVVCLQACGSADVCCQAKCVGVPCPSQSQANATNACEAKCVQGNGTASETQEYAACQASCVSSYYLAASATSAASTSRTGSTSASATATFGGSSTSGSATAGGSASGASASASATHSSGNGADNLHVGSVGLGFLVLVMLGLAL